MTNIDRKIAFLLATSPYLDTVDGEYDEAAMDLTANGVTIQKWISVKERLPKPLTKVLAINKYGDMMVGTYTEWGWMFPSYFEYITHWMKLPEPPKEIGYA